MSLSIPRVTYRTATLVGAGVAILYALIWLWSLPAFTPFPSDEISIIQEIAGRRGQLIDDQNLAYYFLERIIGQQHNGILDIVGGYNLFKAIDDYRSPVYLIFLYLGEGLCHALPVSEGSCRIENIIVDAIVFSNALMVFLLGAATFRITRSVFAQFAAQAMYIFSAWPTTYYFLNSYTVTTAAITLAVFLTQVEAHHRVQQSPVSARMLLIIGGVLCSLALYSSPAAALIVGLLLVAIFAMAWEGSSLADVLDYTKYRLRYIAPFIVAFAVGAILFSLLGLGKLRIHLMENVSGAHYYDAFVLRGHVPQSPFFSYFRILHVYGGFWLSAPIALTLIAVPFLFKGVSDVRSEQVLMAKRAILVLLLIVGLHTLAIDLLPFTKLARAHFVIYPLTVLLVALFGHALYTRLSQRAAVVVISSIGIVLAGMAFMGWQRISETTYLRSALVERMATLRTNHKIYVLSEDPHRKALLTTLNWRSTDEGKIEEIKFEEFYRLAKNGSHAQRLILIVGPHGYRSGMSGARHSALPDFNVSGFPDFAHLRRLIKAVEQVDYYMYYPPFLLEEEVSQAFYFAGMSPDPKSDMSKRITLLGF